MLYACCIKWLLHSISPCVACLTQHYIPQALLEAVDAGKWEALARRRVQHYGHVFSYTARSVDRKQPAAALPVALHAVLARVLAASGMPAADQLTVNEYAPGVGLSAHVDTHSAFGDTMASLSLAGPAVMEFRRGCNPQFLDASLPAEGS